jgi:hypothetical protein
MSSLAVHLPRLLPLAIAWVQTMEVAALAVGRPLSPFETDLAEAVGVKHPDRVRISVVKQLPHPDNSELLAIGIQTDLLGPHTAGVTFGHAIYLLEDQVNNQLVSHELRHVHQYEDFGSIAAFLATYLEQIAAVGYENAPLEIDARQHERIEP